MTDQEKLDAAAYNQSYHFDDLVPNEYNGKDNLEIGKIQDDHIYALVHDGQLNKLDQGEIAPEYFFDQSTFDKYVDPKTGEFDSQALSEALQVQPFPDNATGDGAEYRTSIACFNVNGDIEAPMGYCEANTQFGGGGAHEVYIPHNESSQYQQSGALEYNKEASLINTGKNNNIDGESYRSIDNTSKARVDNCAENNTPHPDLEQCQKDGRYKPFHENERINGDVFGNSPEINNNNNDIKETHNSDIHEQDPSTQNKHGPPNEAAYNEPHENKTQGMPNNSQNVQTTPQNYPDNSSSPNNSKHTDSQNTGTSNDGTYEKKNGMGL